MASPNRKPQGPGSRSLLDARDRIYLASLLLPFALYNLLLMALLVFSGPKAPGFSEDLRLLAPDLLFNLGYALLWVALFGMARQRVLRWSVTGLFQLVTILLSLSTTVAYQFFKVTGSALDTDYLLFVLSSPDGTAGMLRSEAPVGIVALMLAILVYTLLGPSFVTRFAGRRGWPSSGAPQAPRSRLDALRVLGIALLAYALFSFSLLAKGGSPSAPASLSRDALVHVMLAATQAVERKARPGASVDPAAPTARAEATFRAAAPIPRRNVVLILLESTRASATTPYNKQLRTTPFMDALAKRSLLVEQAYTVVPHTHNAIAAISCGVEPPLSPWATLLMSTGRGSLTTCLPDILKQHGYSSVYFTSQEKSFENSEKILKNLGYQEFNSNESMDRAGFERTNYLGYEDDIMLKPTRAWLQAHRDQPFLAMYLTSAPHHDYLAPRKRYGHVEFSTNELLNRYLNSVRDQDFFLKNLFNEYKRLGVYQNTIFVIAGDHGEGFGEHGRYQHNTTIYEEGLRIPLLIHDPSRFGSGARAAGPADDLDIFPTVADLLGLRIQDQSYPGHSLLNPVGKDRTFMFSCWSEKGCLASLKGTEKYIYHFGERPDELFDLRTDPQERNNLAARHTADELNKRRSELLAWRAMIHSRYGTQPADYFAARLAPWPAALALGSLGVCLLVAGSYTIGLPLRERQSLLNPREEAP